MPTKETYFKQLKDEYRLNFWMGTISVWMIVLGIESIVILGFFGLTAAAVPLALFFGAMFSFLLVSAVVSIGALPGLRVKMVTAALEGK